MRRISVAKVILTGALVSGLLFALPNALSAQATNIAPTVIPLAGRFVLPTGQPRTGPVMLVLSLYESQDSLTPIWFERQQTTLDAAGRYEVQFGAAQDGGLPSSLFLAPTPKWIGVGIENEPEQPRAMLISVPYAARAASADTLAGRSVSDFVLTPEAQHDTPAAPHDESSNALRRGREGGATAMSVTQNYLQKGDGSGGITDSIVVNNGANVGIGTTNPQAILHVGAGADVPNLFGLASLYVSSNGASALAIRDSANDVELGMGAQLGQAHLGTRTGHPLYLQIGGNNVGILDSSGKLGIGTLNPQTLLHVGAGADVPNLFGLASLYVSSNGASALAIRDSANDVELGMGAQLGQAHLGTRTGHPLYLQIGGNNVGILDSSGNLGIGTLTPTAKLHVAGNVVVDGNIGAKYQDIAEWVDASEPLYAGTIVTIDTSTTNRVKGATSAYDTRVAGAVSPQPGIVLGEPGAGKVLVAHSGRVRVKADARYGAIRPGDLLVSSPTKGHAMRSPASKARPGTVIGKALEPLPNGRGEILALLTLQ